MPEQTLSARTRYTSSRLRITQVRQLGPYLPVCIALGLVASFIILVIKCKGNLGRTATAHSNEGNTKKRSHDAIKRSSSYSQQGFCEEEELSRQHEQSNTSSKQPVSSCVSVSPETDHGWPYRKTRLGEDLGLANKLDVAANASSREKDPHLCLAELSDPIELFKLELEHVREEWNLKATANNSLFQR